jgi:hypothetical protein
MDRYGAVDNGSMTSSTPVEVSQFSSTLWMLLGAASTAQND